MRIYFVLEYVGGKGGVETVVTEVANVFSSKGHDVRVFLPSPSGDTSWENELPNVYYYNDDKVNISNALQLISERAIGLTKSFSDLPEPDLVIATHVPQTVFYSRMATGLNKKPIIISWLHNPPKRFADPHLINYADLHWSISKGIEKELNDFLAIKNPVYYIGNPFNLNVKQTNPIIGQHFVYIGRLENEQKRLDILFRSLSMFDNDNSWTLDIYGTGPDEDKLKDLAHQLKISNKIRFNGWVQNPWSEIKRITSLILTSDFEGMPMVIGEALARGVPVISTDCETGPRDLITNNYNGWLIPTGDILSLLKVLNHVSSLSQDALNNVSKNAELSIKNYSVQNVIDRMQNSVNAYVR